MGPRENRFPFRFGSRLSRVSGASFQRADRAVSSDDIDDDGRSDQGAEESFMGYVCHTDGARQRRHHLSCPSAALFPGSQLGEYAAEAAKRESSRQFALAPVRAALSFQRV